MTSMLLMLNITDNKQIGVWPLEWAHKHKKVLVPVKVNGQKKNVFVYVLKGVFVLRRVRSRPCAQKCKVRCCMCFFVSYVYVCDFTSILLPACSALVTVRCLEGGPTAWTKPTPDAAAMAFSCLFCVCVLLHVCVLSEWGGG